MTQRLLIFLELFLVLMTTKSFCQSSENYFYYYKDQKLFLELDRSAISIFTDGENDPTKLMALLGDESWNILSPITKDHTRQIQIATDQEAESRKNLQSYYLEIKTDQIVSSEKYAAKIAQIKMLPGILMASPCFTNKYGKKSGLANSFYVELKDEDGLPLLYQTASRLNVEVLGQDPYMPRWFVLSCRNIPPMNAMEMANLFYETGLFKNAEPGFMMHDLAHSTDPFFGSQWSLKNTGQSSGVSDIDIKVESAWTITKGSSNLTTAIFDEGFEINHPDYSSNVPTFGFNAQSNTVNSVIFGSHGTNCAGIVGAIQNNNLGVSGIAPLGKMESISVNFSTNNQQALANGFNRAVSQNFDIISNSWGGGNPSSVLNQAITNALSNGMVVVFSSGNSNQGNGEYPADSNPDIICVGAIDRCGFRAGRANNVPSPCDPWPPGTTIKGQGSSFGSALDVVAGGSSIFTTDQSGSAGEDPTDFFSGFNGTSAACPAVAGVAALVKSANPNLSAAEIRDIIEQSAQKIRPDLHNYGTLSGRPNGTWDNEVGYGLVNAYGAVLLARARACSQNLTISHEVLASYTNDEQASQTIAAINKINANALARYHAADAVIFNPGFSAVSGSEVHATIDGCSGIFLRTQQGPLIETIRQEEHTVEKIAILSGSSSPDLFTVYPNPNSGDFTILFNKATAGKCIITNELGIILFEKSFEQAEKIEMKNCGLPKGIYVLRLISLQKNMKPVKLIID